MALTMTDCRVPSPEEVAAAMTSAGGFTKAQLAEWEVPWPPPRGWRRDLEQRYAADGEQLPKQGK